MWAEQRRELRARGAAGVGKARGKGGSGAAVGCGKQGERLPACAFWQVLDTPPQLLPPPGAPPGCQTDAPVPPSGLGGDHGFANAPLPISKPHGPSAGQL